MNTKPVESLQISDFVAHPVWEYVNDDSIGETAVRPVEQFPVEHLDSRVIGLQVHLANGKLTWATLSNVNVADARSTRHFVFLSIEKSGEWIHLARYLDVDYAQRGPDAVARFLGLSVDNVFPISYDIRRYVNGDSEALSGVILKEPTEKLSRTEIIAIAVGSTIDR